MTTKIDRVFMSGQWHAFNEVLNYINTLEDKQVDKKDIYHYVFSLRPISYKEYKEVKF